MRKGRWLLPVWWLLALLLAGPVLAAELSFQGSTQYLWYTDPFADDDQSDLVQYVRLRASEVGPGGRFTISGYGRLSQQFGADAEELSALGNDDDVLGRLYYLHADYALPADRGLIRLGRQFVVLGAGAGTLDGVRAEVVNLGPVTLQAFGGYSVRFAETSDRTGGGDWLVGAAAGLSFLEKNTVEISYLRKFDEGDTVREMAAVNADVRLIPLVNGYANYRYDILHDAYSEFLGGVKIFALPGLITLTAEYFTAYPNFDADSIYTVFAVTKYWEATGRVDWIVSPQLTLFGAYTRGDFDGPDADVVRLGASAVPEKVPGLSASAAVDIRSGYPGDLTGFRVQAGYALGKAFLAAGVTVDVFEREAMAEDFEAKRFWAGATYALKENLVAKLRVEDTVTRQFADEFQGRASVDYTF